MNVRKIQPPGMKFLMKVIKYELLWKMIVVKPIYDILYLMFSYLLHFLFLSLELTIKYVLLAIT